MTTATELSEETYSTAIASGLVLVDFYAEWCIPCQQLHPVIDSLAREMPHVKFLKVNLDQQPDLANAHGVILAPTLLLYRDGEPVDIITQALPKEALKQRIQQFV